MNKLEITHEEVVNFLKSLGFVVDETEVLKDGKKMIGTTVRRSKEDRVAPAIYIDSEIEYAKSQGADRQQFLMEILRVIRTGFENAPETESLGDVFTPELFRENAMLGVRQTTPDSNELKRPTPYDGLEEYIYMRVNTPNIKGIIRVNKTHLEYLKVTEDEAFDIAAGNIHKETVIMHIADYILATHEDVEGIRDMVGIMRLSPMYIVTTAEQMNDPQVNHHGAAAILDKEAIAKFSEEQDVDRWVVIPSTKSECILVPYSEGADIDMYKEMVIDVNSTIDPSDVLIDAAYVIDGKSGEIAA
jgi:hypothetical protein